MFIEENESDQFKCTFGSKLIEKMCFKIEDKN